jgi:cytolysin-activating lysine-acyltransferase
MAEQTVPNGAAGKARAARRRPGGPNPQGESRSAVLGDIVTILMRAPRHKGLPLDALRHSVMPAIMHNQFRIARVRKAGTRYAAPAGFAVWASVSDVVDQKLRNAGSQPISLTFEEWRSGTNLWLIELVAPSAIAAGLLKEIDEKVGRGRPVFTHSTSQGVMKVTTVDEILSGLQKIPA